MTESPALQNTGGMTVVQADWPLTGAVGVCTTTRIGGVSQAPFDTLNLGLHVGDVEVDVLENRQRMKKALELPAEPAWLKQNHGTAVYEHGKARSDEHFDAAWTNREHSVLTVLTADCLPVVLAAADGTEIGIAHAGWRGLAAGVLQQTVHRFLTTTDVVAWLGPAIGPQHFEVGDEVRQQFMQRFTASPPETVSAAFMPGKITGKWYADLYSLARIALAEAGVNRIYGGDYCTYADDGLFFSYRRDGSASGRMATLAWLR